MKFLAVFVMLMFCSWVSSSKETLSRNKRPTTQLGFEIISNQSLPCEPLLYEYQTSVTELTTAQKDQLFRILGGSTNNNYLASTEDYATEKFPNLLSLSSKYQDKILASRGTKEGLITTQDVMKYMNDTMYYGVQPTRGRHGNRMTYRQLLQSLQGVSDVHERRQAWIEWIRETNPDVSQDVLDFPFHSREMMEETEGKVIPGSKGERSEVITYCVYKGQPTLDGKYLYFCSTCTVAVTMPEDYWPPYLNTASCDPLDGKCIMESGTAHGSCHQLLYPIKMMKKNPNSMCVLLLANGQTIVSYEWFIVDEYFDLGCSCNVFEDSVFAQFAS